MNRHHFGDRLGTQAAARSEAPIADHAEHRAVIRTAVLEPPQTASAAALSRCHSRTVTVFSGGPMARESIFFDLAS